ncbi:DUF3710 domain-containing protein [Glutamicibacter sp. MNS18]|uniref:DUF3710 domain-containing protein n=1 Tax=Glutamicibacter sp. MNS18 TaxID=2989817 RepID=UPI00223582E1|nr:DUF3710 domain-containing protein [Glutamicibacter sp. MNS18]MCW4464469.1 DUF3710 domain-containing protein [Glutamicibacter sp. MNS18]
MIFKRKKRNQVQPDADEEQQAAQAGADAPQVAPQEPATGPWDIKDIENPDDYLNFGSLLIKPMTGLKVRMDVEEKTKRVISLSLEVAESRIQLQAFARSKSQELWPGISNKIAEDISKQKGELFTREGELGKELLAKVPQQLPDGRAGHVALRFIGVDGPRWFLRVVIGGAAISNEQAAGIVDELVRGVVVNRGEKPLPPQELLPLNVPSNATTRAEPVAGAPSVQRPERGPEITQIG